MIALNYSRASQLNDSCCLLLRVLLFHLLSRHHRRAAGFCDISTTTNSHGSDVHAMVGVLIVNDAVVAGLFL